MLNQTSSNLLFFQKWAEYDQKSRDILIKWMVLTWQNLFGRETIYSRH